MFHDDDPTRDFTDPDITLCGGATRGDPGCNAPGLYLDAAGHAVCRDHGAVAPRDLAEEYAESLRAAAEQGRYDLAAALLERAGVSLSWLRDAWLPDAQTSAHPVLVALVRLGLDVDPLRAALAAHAEVTSSPQALREALAVAARPVPAAAPAAMRLVPDTETADRDRLLELVPGIGQPATRLGQTWLVFLGLDCYLVLAPSGQVQMAERLIFLTSLRVPSSLLHGARVEHVALPPHGELAVRALPLGSPLVPGRDQATMLWDTQTDGVRVHGFQGTNPAHTADLAANVRGLVSMLRGWGVPLKALAKEIVRQLRAAEARRHGPPDLTEEEANDRTVQLLIEAGRDQRERPGDEAQAARVAARLFGDPEATQELAAAPEGEVGP